MTVQCSALKGHLDHSTPHQGSGNVTDEGAERMYKNRQMGHDLATALMNAGQLFLACNQQRQLTFRQRRGRGTGNTTKAEELLVGSGCWRRRRG